MIDSFDSLVYNPQTNPEYLLFDYCLALCIQVGSDSEPEQPAWRFNVSHQGDYAVLAADQGRQVGVDVMKTTMPGECRD